MELYGASKMYGDFRAEDENLHYQWRHVFGDIRPKVPANSTAPVIKTEDLDKKQTKFYF